jgi:hypothetical protein
MLFPRTIVLAVSALTSNLHQFLPAPPSGHLSTPTCLDDFSIPTLEQLVDCLDTYVVPHDYYNQTTYTESQPSEVERSAWSDAVTLLLAVDNDCSSIILPPPIAELYSVSVFAESTSASYCVLSEATIKDGVYTKGWGLFIVPASPAAVRRHLHISAPHPRWDAHTHKQAAAMFTSTGAKSLLIPGRVRTAFLDPTECVVGESDQDPYYRTDPAHDTVRRLPFIYFGVDD